jgi:glutathione peroxidase
VLQDKIEVNGVGAHPLYQFLRKQQPVSAPGAARPVPGGGPGAIEWNYVKFLVDREGQAVKRYKPAFDPLEFESDVSGAAMELGSVRLRMEQAGC